MNLGIVEEGQLTWREMQARRADMDGGGQTFTSPEHIASLVYDAAQAASGAVGEAKITAGLERVASSMDGAYLNASGAVGERLEQGRQSDNLVGRAVVRSLWLPSLFLTQF